jgi:predicted RNase H-like HicB family nuclease
VSEVAPGAALSYAGVVDGAGEVWGVVVPDLPGVHGGGATREAAIADARSAMREWATAMRAEGRPIPPPRELAIVVDEAERDLPGCPVSGVMIPLD